MPECAECVRLRGEHAAATVDHTLLQVRLKRAVAQSQEELVTTLLVSVADALRGKDAAESAMRRHEAIVHGEGPAKGETA